MRIIFSLDKYKKNEGGADKLAKGIVQSLLQMGHSVRVMQGGRDEDFEGEGELEIKTKVLRKPVFIKDNDYLTIYWNKIWENIIRNEIEEYKPDILLTQNILAPASVSVAKEMEIKSLILFHGYRPLTPLFFKGEDALTAEKPSFANLPIRYKLKWRLIKKNLSLYSAAYKTADTVVANSKYIAKVIKKFFDRDSELMYPIIDLKKNNDDFMPNNNASILFVKPQEIKGINILLEVANKMTDKRFTVVGTASKGLRNKMSRQENITHIPWTDDMDAMYKSSSLLFAPAQIPEPFGRVFVEAGLRGIPSVATNAGGIPEAVGKGGKLIDMHSSVDEWCSAINEVLSEENYQTFCNNAKNNANQLLTRTDALQSIFL